MELLIRNIYIYLGMHTYIRGYICVYQRICTYYLCVYAGKQIYAQSCIYTHMYLYMCASMYVGKIYIHKHGCMYATHLAQVNFFLVSLQLLTFQLDTKISTRYKHVLYDAQRPLPFFSFSSLLLPYSLLPIFLKLDREANQPSNWVMGHPIRPENSVWSCTRDEDADENLSKKIV